MKTLRSILLNGADCESIAIAQNYRSTQNLAAILWGIEQLAAVVRERSRARAAKTSNCGGRLMFIPWWVLALLPAAIGIALASRVDTGGYLDFASPLLFLALFLGGILCTLCIFVGHFL